MCPLFLSLDHGVDSRFRPKTNGDRAAGPTSVVLRSCLQIHRDGEGMAGQAVREVVLLIEPILDEMGIELVDIEYLSEGGRWVLRIYVDRDGGITLDDCVQVSREIEDLIDVKEFFKQPYVLEVSSPGLNRPLKREKDFVRAIGEEVSIRTSAPVGGRRNFKGRLQSFENGMLCVVINDDPFLIPYEGVEKAHLVYDFGDTR